MGRSLILKRIAVAAVVSFRERLEGRYKLQLFRRPEVMTKFRLHKSDRNLEWSFFLFLILILISYIFRFWDSGLRLRQQL